MTGCTPAHADAGVRGGSPAAGLVQRHELRKAPDEQVAAFREVLLRNPTLAEMLTRAAVPGLPGWYLVAGCHYRTFQQAEDAVIRAVTYVRPHRPA